jgi:methylphosphotriester-DNA--protein-cysteine methyltransferase
MAMPTLVQRGSAGGVAWESATRPLPALLLPHVRRMQGYDERTSAPLVRPELPGSSVVMILELGPPIGVQPLGEAEASRSAGGFVAALDKRPVLTMHDGWQRGVQLDLSATGARRVLGVPMSELQGRVVALHELLRPHERSLPDELDALPTWQARLDRVDRWLHARLAAGPRPDRRVVWAVQEIEAHGGNVDVTALGRALQLSGKHLVALFREHVGVPPKLYARLVRFERLVERVRGGPPLPWAERAAALGYCDQAHLARDVRALAGMTPTELAASLGAPSLPAVWPDGPAHEQPAQHAR